MIEIIGSSVVSIYLTDTHYMVGARFMRLLRTLHFCNFVKALLWLSNKLQFVNKYIAEHAHNILFLSASELLRGTLVPCKSKKSELLSACITSPGEFSKEFTVFVISSFINGFFKHRNITSVGRQWNANGQKRSQANQSILASF